MYRGIPDLIIEIVSPSTVKIDKNLKMDLYQKYDLKEYWIIDPELEVVLVYKNEEGILQLQRSYSRIDILKTDIFPELEIKLEEVFSE